MPMKSRTSLRWPVLLGVAVSCLLCLALQGVAWEFLHRHNARFISENHYHITLGRLQNASLLVGNTVMLGSSITERLISTDEIAVIGVPGSSFLGGMHFVPYDSFPKGTVFVLEANNIFSGIVQGVIDDTNKWTFRVFRGSRHFSIAAKPSSLLLSLIYFWKDPRKALSTDREVLPGKPVEPYSLSVRPPEDEAARLAECRYRSLLDGMAELRSRGYRLCLAYIPERSTSHHAENLARVRELAVLADVPLLDYTGSEAARQLEWTDDRHLNSKALSTARLRNTIARDARQWAR